MIHFWKALGLYLNNLKKFANLQNFKYLLQYQGIEQKMRKTKSPRNMINYTNLKALTTANSNTQKYKFTKFLKTISAFQEN